ncbi:hypothetical protein FQN50_009722 [Emmonsiellopsis sp. PD_5]|nr:hypothetical protein FQN50_009722 [Emmonsiellopsis sp. PD_5]
MSQHPPVQQDQGQGKPYWSEKERKRLKALRKRPKGLEADIDPLENGTSSEEYWSNYLTMLELDKEIGQLEWEREAHGYSPGDPDYRQAGKEYTLRREELDQRYESSKRKPERHRKRNKVLSLLKTNNDVSLRHALVQLVMSMFEKTSRSNQADFVKALRKAYGTNNLPGGETAGLERLRRRLDKQQGDQSSTYLPSVIWTGIYDAKGEINSARNGLFMYESIEEQFDKHQIVIVPDDGFPQGQQPREWKVYVLNQSLKNDTVYPVEPSITFGDLHGMKLVFRNDNQPRPRARYFYFHYLVALIKLSRAGANSGVDKFDLPEASMPALTRAWGSEGSYIRENVIRGFVEELGDEIPEEAGRRILQNSSEGIAPDEPERLGKAVEDTDLDSDDEEEEPISTWR